MNILVSDKQIPYSGRELRPHWLFEEFGLRGDAAAAWVAPCLVSIEDLVDIEDADAGSGIASDSMLHIIIEHFFEPKLLLTIHRQYLLASNAAHLFFEHSGEMPERTGNDLYIGDSKLSVSIATISPVSGLIHFGINVTTEGTPVLTSALEDFDIEPLPFASELLTRYAADIEAMNKALCKVRPR